MATKKPRVNVTFEDKTASFLTQIAKKRKMTVSRLIKNLVLDALERQEDMVLSAMAELRNIEGAETMGHEEFWK